MRLSKDGGGNSQTGRTAAGTAATADQIKANITLHIITWNIHMQPEDIREELAGKLPFNIVCTVTAC